MKVTTYVEDIQSICEKIKQRQTPIEWIHDATEITKICKSLVDYAAELAMKDNPQQSELNI